MKKKARRVTMRLPLVVIDRVRRVAKVAEVTPTQVYVVLLAWAMESQRDNAPSPPPQLHAGMLICQECGTDRVDPRSVCPKGADYRCPMIAKA